MPAHHPLAGERGHLLDQPVVVQYVRYLGDLLSRQHVGLLEHADNLARIVGVSAAEMLGQQIVIDNRAGAGGTITARTS